MAAVFFPYEIEATAATNVWIVGSTRTGPPEALVFDGRSWHATHLPTMGATVLSRTDAWGVESAGCSSRGTRLVCTSSVWHWSNGNVTSYSFAGLAAGVTGAGGRAWILSHRAIRDPDRPAHMSSLAALYYGNASGLHPVSAPRGRMSIFPQLAASPRGQLWLLAPALDGGRKPSVVDYWNGHRWARHPIPARKNIWYGSWGLAYDDHQGVWLGPYLHWTGSQWISTRPHRPTQAFVLIYVAPIAGSASAWAVGVNNSSPRISDSRCLITLYGSRP